MSDANERGSSVQGNVVLLNGTSSAGKTSIAKALQAIMDTPYLHTGIDHFLPRIPARFTQVSDGIHPATADYFLMVYQDNAPRRQATIEGGETAYGEGTLADVRIGPAGVKLLAGMYHAVAALAAAGVDVILDDVIYDPRVLEAAVRALRAARVLFVGLRLPLAVAERRERDRGDRGPGGAALFYDRVHAHGRYDLELDTAALDPMTCAVRIKAAIQTDQPGMAFRQLAARLPK
jgi:chloramphenicol 3-O phosphotransferase